MVEYGETVVVALVDTDGDDTVDNVTHVEGFATSVVVLKARLLVKFEVAVCVAESGTLADLLPEKAMAAVEFWTGFVRTKASAQGIKDI